MLNRAQRRAARAQGRWVPLERYARIHLTREQQEIFVAHAIEVLPELDAAHVSDKLAQSEIVEKWGNSDYRVSVIPWPALKINGHSTPVVQLSISRVDRTAARDWRDFQRIKNQLVGPDCEAIELYPAESRLVDTANQFHLWCVAEPLFRFPFGYTSRLVTGESGGGAVQRPLEEHSPYSQALVDRIEHEKAEQLARERAASGSSGLSASPSGSGYRRFARYAHRRIARLAAGAVDGPPDDGEGTMISVAEAKERVERWADFVKEDRAPVEEWPECDRERDEVLALLDWLQAELLRAETSPEMPPSGV